MTGERTTGQDAVRLLQQDALLLQRELPADADRLPEARHLRLPARPPHPAGPRGRGVRHSHVREHTHLRLTLV